MLKIRLFGSGQAHFQDQAFNGFPNQQGCLLLCYLLLNKPHPQNRDRLASAFWGNLPTHTSRKYLRNAIWRLRQTMQTAGVQSEEYIFVSEDSVSFINTRDTWLDIEVFEDTINRTLHLAEQDITVDQVKALEAAIDLYIGDLLESCYEDWCLYDRERYRLLYAHALNKLMLCHTQSAHYSQALAIGERLLALDNTQEKAHRLMMWLYWGQGNRSAAIQQYKRCFEILREELGLRPAPETRLLYDKILSGQENPRAQADITSSPVLATKKDTVAKPKAEAQTGLLVANALQRLHRLQDTIEETRTELQQIESLIHEAMTHPGSS